MAAARKNFTVKSAPGLNVRKQPSLGAEVLRVLTDGEKVTIVTDAEAPEGWAAVKAGGYVMKAYLK